MMHTQRLLLSMLLILPTQIQAQTEPRDKAKQAIKIEDLSRLFDPQAMEDPQARAAAIATLEEAFPGARQPEAVRMLLAILRGDQMGGDSGWFGPAETRYTWNWLARRCGVEQQDIPRSKFGGPDAWFDTLDRNKDGMITASDLDWSERRPDAQMMLWANRLFRRINTGDNGRLTREEWLKFFEKAGQGKEYLAPEDLRAALAGGMPGNAPGGFLAGDAPTRIMLLRGLYDGSIGSIHEGPRVDQPAPDFTLKTVDGKTSIQLSKLNGAKPVVLVLGNFTCGPYRSLFAGIEKMAQRYQKDAHFLMVYVREAHPLNGWKMESNTRANVAVKQPTTREERVAVAGQFCARLKATMPVVVDEINDTVGHAYSGMPGRFYLIDRQGKVAYKSGRGPFGFRLGEMEQALVMALHEHAR